ncbi:hypothetical protein [Sciscionella sediminilitoris]|uniref:hypothetical protein n=1 Tax=Sciscionella sediminilitoris TaxID=1445613 RepID=UPI00068DCC04|nr:hypothetical protein [Sciscionella sp. SE31]
MLLLLGGVLAMLRAPRDSSPLRDRAAARRYGITVGAEFGVCGVGAAILGVTGHAEFIAALICFVVGIHFTPLNRVFPGIGMLALSGAVTAVAIAALITGLLSPVLPSTVTGLGAGICLLGHGASLLTGALSRKTA